MKIIASLSVELPNLTRLIVIVEKCDGSDESLIAYGVVPDHLDPDRGQPVFARRLAADELGAFLERIVNGNDPDSAAERGGLSRSVDTPVDQPPTTGPKIRVVLRYASTLRNDELVAQVSSENAVAAPAQDTPRPP